MGSLYWHNKQVAFEIFEIRWILNISNFVNITVSGSSLYMLNIRSITGFANIERNGLNSLKSSIYKLFQLRYVVNNVFMNVVKKKSIKMI